MKFSTRKFSCKDSPVVRVDDAYLEPKNWRIKTFTSRDGSDSEEEDAIEAMLIDDDYFPEGYCVTVFFC
jgi:hypothetical protein